MICISLIATVLNEESAIDALLTSLATQTRPPDEVVIVDGGSTDATPQRILAHQDKLPLRLLHAPGCNISAGRNRAIQAATHDIIVATDAGVRIPPDWLEQLVAPLEADPTLAGVAGFFHADPDPTCPFEVAMSATVLPLRDEINPQTFLPSSRSVAFRKAGWAAIGGYPEWLDYCEDLIFDIQIKERVGEFAFAPDAYVYFKPRTSLTTFFKQYYRYARGDGKADLWRKRHVIRYVTYFGIIPSVAWLMRRFHPLFGGLYLLGALGYLRQPYRRLHHFTAQLSAFAKLEAIAYVPLIRVVGDLAKMLGYPMGLWWRRRNQPPNWRDAE